MTWDEVLIDDWLVTTAELRKHKGLDKIVLTTKHRDVREKIKSRYDNYVIGFTLVIQALGVTTDSFQKRCRGDVQFTEKEKAILTKMLSLSPEEQETYFAE